VLQCTHINTESHTMSSATMTIRLDEELKRHLEKLAVATQRSKSFLANLAIAEYIRVQEWQINEITQGIAEADAGDLVDHHKVIKRWSKKREHPLDN
jgi:RHH-type rel operon transcriptional repressor/antitoxin RelB